MSAVILRRRRLGAGSCSGIQAASEAGIAVVRNWVETDWQGREGPSYVFRWGCTSSLPDLENDPPVINRASSIHWCSQKKQGRLDMQAAGVPVPETWAVGRDIVSSAPDHDEGQFVARPNQHAQGRNLFVGDFISCADWLAEGFGGGYISRLIDKIAEYRVMVIQNRVAWVAQKTPGNPEDVAWNVAQGGRFDNVRWGNWPLRVVEAALKAAKVSGTDFCGVDVMVDKDGNPYVLEVNSAPSQTSPYRQQCVAKCFDYIVEESREHFDDPVDYRGWRSVIHPALRGD